MKFHLAGNLYHCIVCLYYLNECDDQLHYITRGIRVCYYGYRPVSALILASTAGMAALLPAGMVLKSIGDKAANDITELDWQIYLR